MGSSSSGRAERFAWAARKADLRELSKACRPYAARNYDVNEPRECIGYPEIGECSNEATSRSQYCKECLELKRAHQGRPQVHNVNNPWGSQGKPRHIAEDEDDGSD